MKNSSKTLILSALITLVLSALIFIPSSYLISKYLANATYEKKEQEKAQEEAKKVADEGIALENRSECLLEASEWLYEAKVNWCEKNNNLGGTVPEVVCMTVEFRNSKETENIRLEYKEKQEACDEIN